MNVVEKRKNEKNADREKMEIVSDNVQLRSNQINTKLSVSFTWHDRDRSNIYLST